MTGAVSQTKTIHEYFAENPNVDVTETHQALFGMLVEMREKIEARFPGLTVQPACADLEYWTSESGDYEGSMQTWTGPGVDHLANSWIGNRKASILDMNLQVWLDQSIDVPHLVMVFGTIPEIFYYSDFVPRSDLMVDIDYLQRYYAEEDPDFLAMRGDTQYTWSVSHGVYMRAFNSPVAHSYTAPRTQETIDNLRPAVEGRVNRWLSWVDRASAGDPVPEADRLALMDRDHRIRTWGYALDPMNAISKRFLGEQRVEQLLKVRYGHEQIVAARAAAGLSTQWPPPVSTDQLN
jgi:hypothetical protein